MAELPLELFQVIAKDVEDDSSIFDLRLVSKTLNSVATPLAFRVVVVYDNLKSAKAVSFLQDCNESVTSLVRELVFRGDPKNHQNTWRVETSGESGRNALKTVFSKLTKFSNLESLRLNFHACYQEDVVHEIPENPSHFLRLQNEVFAALAANPPQPLVSLTLNNVLAIPNDIYAQGNFHWLFRSLQELDISVLSDVDYEGSYFQDSIVEFWDQSVAHMVRSATAVTALTIRSDQGVGACPALSFKDTYLPGLTSLALYQFVFEPAISDSDVVAFILRHKATLTCLELHDCSIDGGEGGDFTRPWHAVLGLFEANLGALREFVFDNGSEPNPDEDAFERDPRFEYTRLDPGWGYMPWEEEIATEGLDMPALESLMVVAKSR